ncbi:hypothetical protein AXK56_14430 [Tsukamurella pulmonis]|uniref:Uncharacterized protein n=1 Tax=Tsukamurella pulmonis TaxID=47312 RepID=A0A1H1FPN3_9ACTN|nr:hypothetical protein [Tsukamurella pulmonis]KXO87619.1 hypothetical protein AXK56_14430 [Tsukamurella pulmonis]SDR02864.1 hypothetical protein SAMN04489765_2840 [Tsukamurella pulmonis]SUP18640.1 Uncharacterised protein [Tsukamurella pulmonis]
MHDDTDGAPESAWQKFWPGAFVGIVLFFPAYLLATIVYAVMGRHGIPLGPFLSLPIGAVLLGIATSVEDSVQSAAFWPKIEDAWYLLPGLATHVLPIALAVVAPYPIATGVPGGASVLVAGALVFVPAGLAIGRARRKNRRDQN